jgi:hypothetical protein
LVWNENTFERQSRLLGQDTDEMKGYENGRRSERFKLLNKVFEIYVPSFELFEWMNP